MNALLPLRTAVETLGATAGSLHLRRGDVLELVGEIGLPPEVIPLILTIPKGKGMAGHAWVTLEPTTTCNLETDREAPIEPGARLIAARSAAAIPVCEPPGTILGVVGFAFADERGFDEDRLAQCKAQARQVLFYTLSRTLGPEDSP